MEKIDQNQKIDQKSKKSDQKSKNCEQKSTNFDQKSKTFTKNRNMQISLICILTSQFENLTPPPPEPACFISNIFKNYYKKCPAPTGT